MTAVDNYLYFWKENAKANEQAPLINLEAAKEKVRKNFLAKFRNSQSDIKARRTNDKQIINFLRDMSEGGLIGETIIRQLENFNLLAPGDNTTVPTGAGMTTTNLIPEDAPKIIEEANQKLNAIVDALDRAQQPLMALDLMNSVGMQVPDWFSAKHGTLIPSSDRAIYEIVKEENVKTIKSIMSSLGAGGDDLNVSKLANSLKSAFNSLGGEIYEIVVQYLFNEASKEMKEEVVKTDQQINKIPNIVLHEDSKLTGREMDIGGKQGKGDIKVTATKGKITYEISGSIKNTQRDKFLKNNTLKNFQISGNDGFTLEYLLTKGLELNGSSTSLRPYYLGLAAIATNNGKDGHDKAKISEGDAIAISYNNAKRAGVYYAGMEIISQGPNANDVAGIIVLNNKVFSVYEVLSKALENDSFTKEHDNDYRYSLIFENLQKDFDTYKEAGPDYKYTRSEKVRQEINTWMQKKSTITVNLKDSLIL